VAAVIVVVAFVTLRDWYAEERYRRLRVHELRRYRFQIEQLIAEMPTRRVGAAIIVTIDELPPARWLNGGMPIERSTVSPSLSTLDSLVAGGRKVTVTPARGTADVTLTLAMTLRAGGWHTAAVLDRPSDLDPVADPRDPDGGARREVEWREAFDRLSDAPPRITGFVTEGEATWTSLQGVRVLADVTDTRLFLWLRYSELGPPPLSHERFPAASERESELAAIDHYLGRVLAAVRAAGGESTPILVFGEDGSDQMMEGCAVGLDVADTVTVFELATALSGPVIMR